MTGSDELASLLNQGFNGLEDKAQQCIDKFNAAVHHITDWRFVLGPALFVIRPAIDKIREDLEKLVKLIRTAVDHHMPVVSLIVQSFNWVDHVQAPVNLLTHEDSHLRYYWEGIASSAYQDKVAKQNDAISALANKSNEISKWLIDIAKYNVEYVTELAKMATGFLGALVAAAIEAATVVEIPFAVKDLAGAIGTLVTQALDNLVGIAKRFVEALSKVRDIKALMAGDGVLLDTWPQAVVG